MLSLSAWCVSLRHDRGVYALHAPLPDLPAPNDSLRWWIAVFTVLISDPSSRCGGWTMRLIDYRRRDKGRYRMVEDAEKLVIAKLYFPEEAMDTTIVGVGG